MTTKYFVVSDVHSFFSLLMQKLEEQGFDITNPCHKIILCGDGYDRGKEAKQMQDFLVSMMQQNRLIYVCGNHEDLLIDMVQELPNIVDHIEWTHHARCCTQYASKFRKLSSGHRMEKVSFHFNPKERQCQIMLKLPHNCTHLTC